MLYSNLPCRLPKSTRNADIVLYVAKIVNDLRLLSGFKCTTLFCMAHIQMYVKLGFKYRVQIILPQTNCSKPPENQVCIPQPDATTIMAEALVYVQPWVGAWSIGSVEIQVRNCSVPQQSEQAPLRDCSTYLPHVHSQAAKCFVVSEE